MRDQLLRESTEAIDMFTDLIGSQLIQKGCPSPAMGLCAEDIVNKKVFSMLANPMLITLEISAI